MFTSGNTLANVEVPTSGFAAVNRAATEPPTLEELNNTTGLPTGYTYLGLLADGGGYSEEVNTGDIINTWTPDWRVQWGEYGISGKIIAAENNSVVKQLQGNASNSRRDTHQIGTVGLITGEIRDNGKAFIRGGMANFTSITPSFGKQGNVNTIEFGFEWEWNTTINGYYRYASPTFTCTPTRPGTNTVYTKPCTTCNTQQGTNYEYITLVNKNTSGCELRNGATQINNYINMPAANGTTYATLLSPPFTLHNGDIVTITAGTDGYYPCQVIKEVRGQIAQIQSTVTNNTVTATYVYTTAGGATQSMRFGFRNTNTNVSNISDPVIMIARAT